MKFPNKIEYAYRLKGFDNWNYIKNNRKAIYTNIPKGDYVFQVKSTNSDGVWSNKIKEIPITILPSFWESIYGILLYIILYVNCRHHSLYPIHYLQTQKQSLCRETDTGYKD